MAIAECDGTDKGKAKENQVQVKVMYAYATNYQPFHGGCTDEPIMLPILRHLTMFGTKR